MHAALNIRETKLFINSRINFSCQEFREIWLRGRINLAFNRLTFNYANTDFYRSPTEMRTHFCGRFHVQKRSRKTQFTVRIVLHLHDRKDQPLFSSGA